MDGKELKRKERKEFFFWLFMEIMALFEEFLIQLLMASLPKISKIQKLILNLNNFTIFFKTFSLKSEPRKSANRFNVRQTAQHSQLSSPISIRTNPLHFRQFLFIYGQLKINRNEKEFVI